MDSNLKGNIAEAEALKYFIKNGYEVYIPFGTATKCDLVILKNNVLERVSVKSTSSFREGKYIVKISQGKLNKNTPFDKDSSDILFIYILPEDRIEILYSKEISQKFEIRL